jgi:hypothetical protein
MAPHKKKKEVVSSMRKKGKQKTEVVFDPEARRAHLRGFSDRKKERRAYGLAMQRIKDRKEKIGQRAQEKADDMERIEEAEKQKEELLEEAMRNTGALKDDDDESGSDDESKEEEMKGKEDFNIIKTKTYDDKQTESHWGGQVTVTTSEVPLDDDSDDEDDLPVPKRSKQSVDLQQKYAGNVDKYMDVLKKKMPGKKKDTQNRKRKGKNGAADMPGMGGSANLKIAQKMLTKSKALSKSSGGASSSKKGRKGRR